jgi:hypothetical protein
MAPQRGHVSFSPILFLHLVQRSAGPHSNISPQMIIPNIPPIIREARTASDLNELPSSITSNNNGGIRNIAKHNVPPIT